MCVQAHLLRLYTRAEVEERSMARRKRPEGTSLAGALALHGVSGDSGSHLGSTLKPGGAVLTLGVFRRSRSVACIRADASPSEVLARAIVPPNSEGVNYARADGCQNGFSASALHTVARRSFAVEIICAKSSFTQALSRFKAVGS